MKKILLIGLAILCPVFSSILQAQQADTTTITGLVDYVIQYLDKSQVTTGVLYDRSPDISGLRFFNTGRYPDTTSAELMMQAYADLQKACLPGRQVFDRETSIIRASARNWLRKSKIPLTILNCEFNVLDSLAIQKGLLVYDADSNLLNAPGIGASPYLLEKRVLIGVQSEMDLYANKVYRLVIPNDLRLENCTRQVSQISVTLPETGRTITMQPGDTNGIEFSFATGGQKDMSFLIAMSDNSTFTVHSTFAVTEDPDWEALFPPCFKETISPSSPYQAEKEYLGLGGVGDLWWWYANSVDNECTLSLNAGTINKPIIFLDGFDPQDSRNGSQIYGNFLKFSEGTTDNYLGRILRLSSYGYDVGILNFIEHHKEYVQSNYGPLLVSYIDGGADYIQRNALLLVEVIQRTNARLAASGSTEQLVIVGPSMGGQISRYALAYMEKKFQQTNDPVWKHNCRLWVSFDSPHNGANIPLGVQWFLKYFMDKGNESAKRAITDQILSPAAQQMLNYHYASDIEGGPSNGAPGFHDEYYQELNANGKPNSGGFPMDCRKIALVNGSMNGTKVHNGPNCERRLHMRTHLGWKINWNFGFFRIRSTIRAIQVASGKVSYLGDNGTNCQVFHGTYLGNVINRDKASMAFTQSDENAPGGKLDILNELSNGDGFESFFNSSWRTAMKIAALQAGSLITIPLSVAFGDLGVNVATKINDPNCSFINTKSALAFKNQASDLGENLTNRHLVCSGEIPFDNYFGENTNSEHVRLSKAKVDWVLAELNGLPGQAPVALPITGPQVLCNPATDVEYSVSLNACPGCNLYWLPEDGLTITGGQGTTAIQVSTTAATGNPVLRFSASNGSNCIYQTSKNLHIGMPDGIEHSHVSNLPNGGYVRQLTSSVGTNWANPSVITPHPNCDVDAQIYTNGHLKVSCGIETPWPTCAGTVTITGQNVCGTVTRSLPYNCFKPKRAGVNPKFPVINIDQEVSVSLYSEENMLYRNGFSGRVFDGRGMEVSKFQASSNPHLLDISSLSPSEYTVKLLNDEGEESETSFVLMKTGLDKITVSPNPVFKGVDEMVQVKILDEMNADESFDVAVDDFGGLRHLSLFGQPREFRMDISNLPIGSYILTITGANSQFQENLELTMKGEPYIWLSPNPATELVSAQIFNPLKEDIKYLVSITDKMGNEVFRFSTTENPIDLITLDLPADLYFMHVTDGFKQYNKMFRKI